jgi:outer membrane protein assembly factor BamB
VQSGLRSPPVVADDTLYLTSENDRVIALSTRFGEQQWSKSISIRTPATLAVTDSVLAVPRRDGTLYMLDPDTGTERYQFDAGERCYSPVLSDGVLCVGITDGVRAIEPTTSAQQ